MTKKTLVAAVVFVFLLVSNVCAIPPNNADLQNYMKHRFVHFYVPGENWTVDFRHVISYNYKGGSTLSEIIQFSNGNSYTIPANTPGVSQIDGGPTFPSVGDAWLKYIKIVAANPQFLTIP